MEFEVQMGNTLNMITEGKM